MCRPAGGPAGVTGDATKGRGVDKGWPSIGTAQHILQFALHNKKNWKKNSMWGITCFAAGIGTRSWKRQGVPMSKRSAVDDLLQRIAGEFDALPRQLQGVATYLEQQRANIMVQRINEIAD